MDMRFTKNDNKKSRLDLLPPDALELVGFVLRNGAIKYAPENWRKCKEPERYVTAMLRHIFAHMKGEALDKESGLLHLAHAVCSGLFALELFMQLGYTDKVRPKFINYFAVIEKKSNHRGLVKKRFRTWEKAWGWIADRNLDPDKVFVRTVEPSQKLGSTIRV